MIRQYELVEKVKAYDPAADEDSINRAYVFAMRAHGAQKRASGDPYFSHPLEVAGILTRFRLDADSIVTALLHDTLEDTPTSLDDIEKNFGNNVSRLVDGVTKLTRIELQSDHKQAENFRKLLLAMSEDIRVLLVKLADRLHNMRTLRYIKKPEKRVRIAAETLEIYAPLAERIGVQEIKTELENLAFAEVNPEAFESVVNRLEFLRAEGEDLTQRIIGELKKGLRVGGVVATIAGREKSPYSIWRKMQRRNITFEQLSDIMAFRVIVESVEDCYRVLGLIHGNYPVVPGRFKDYISTPKPNGYQSLHTAVLGPERHRIEVQIRTQEMHEVAELGVAAHWQYKQGTRTDGKQYRWLRELLDILEHTSNPEEFLEHTKLAMFEDQVFCFTPKGDLYALPSGATPVDFAYAVHSQIGDTCVGAKINGRIRPLRTKLENGDQVEIMTSKAQTPSPAWEKFVATGKARAAIRRFIRQRQKDEYANLGRALLQREFRKEGYEYTEKALDPALKYFAMATAEDLCAEVGAAHRTAREVLEAVFPGLKEKAAREAARKKEKRQLTAPPRPQPKDSDQAIPIRGLISGMAVHYAQCCHPLPGDRIVGIITTGKGVTIHTIDCENLENYQDDLDRWIDVAWNQENENVTPRVGRLQVTLANEPGSLGNLSTVIAKNHANIVNLKITNRAVDFFDMLVDVEVDGVKHLSHIIAALRASPAISSVDRFRG
ncbi:MAG: RelA/SpoT family protein [Magnetospiraceae bacterium]